MIQDLINHWFGDISHLGYVIIYGGLLILVLKFVFPIESFIAEIGEKGYKITVKPKQVPDKKTCQPNSNIGYPERHFIFNTKLSDEEFRYFVESYIWKHWILTPNDYETLTQMTSSDERKNFDKWIQNWNKQEWWDVSFRKIKKFVKVNKKELEKFLNSLEYDKSISG